MSRVARAALLGLIGGLALGALALAAAAAANFGRECAGPSAQECAFEAELGAQLGRLQGLGALGLGLVAGGLALALRRR